jgi:biotin carboxylase
VEREMNHFVFVESNTTGTGAIAVQRLLSAGHAVTFMTRSREKYPFLEGASAGLRVLELETNDAAQVIGAVRGMQRRARVDALLTFSEFYVTVVAQAARSCGLRGLDPSAATTCRNKDLTRSALRTAGLATPDFWMVSSERDARWLARHVRYPCIVKPPADSSSHGVRMVSTGEELLAHYRTLSAWTENVRGQHLDGGVLIESLLEGAEYSVETMTLAPGATRVIGVTDKHLSEPPHFVELGHDFPSNAEERVRHGLEEMTLRALAAVGFDFGPAHTELRWTRAGPVVVEINPRLAGGMIPELVWHATGIDLLAAWFDLLLGNPVSLVPRRAHSASIRFLTSTRSGRLAGSCGTAEARAFDSVREVCVTRGTGDRVRPPGDAYDRLGWVIGSGEDRRRVVREVDAARRAIRLEVEADPPPPPSPVALDGLHGA